VECPCRCGEGSQSRPRGRKRGVEKKFGAPDIVMTASTIAKEIELKDPVRKDRPPSWMQQVAQNRTRAAMATTTATLLAQAWLQGRSAQRGRAGANPVGLRPRMEAATRDS